MIAGRGDNAEIAALSHEIVGAAGHLGLGLMSHFAAHASQAARGGDPAEWVEALLEGAGSASIGTTPRLLRHMPPTKDAA